MFATTVPSRVLGKCVLRRGVISGRTSLVSSPCLLNLNNKRNYHENIVEHYENPRNVGSLDKNESSVGTVR